MLAFQEDEKASESLHLINCSVLALNQTIKGKDHCIHIFRYQPSKHFLLASETKGMIISLHLKQICL